MTAGDYAERYVRALRQKARGLPLRTRFYLFDDPDLTQIEMDADRAGPDAAEELYRRVARVYRSWMRRMTEEQWRELERHNESLPGALRNHWIGDVLTWPPSARRRARPQSDSGPHIPQPSSSPPLRRPRRRG